MVDHLVKVGICGELGLAGETGVVGTSIPIEDYPSWSDTDLGTFLADTRPVKA